MKQEMKNFKKLKKYMEMNDECIDESDIIE